MCAPNPPTVDRPQKLLAFRILVATERSIVDAESVTPEGKVSLNLRIGQFSNEDISLV